MHIIHIIHHFTCVLRYWGRDHNAKFINFDTEFIICNEKSGAQSWPKGFLRLAADLYWMILKWPHFQYCSEKAPEKAPEKAAISTEIRYKFAEICGATHCGVIEDVLCLPETKRKSVFFKPKSTVCSRKITIFQSKILISLTSARPWLRVKSEKKSQNQSKVNRKATETQNELNPKSTENRTWGHEQCDAVYLRSIETHHFSFFNRNSSLLNEESTPLRWCTFGSGTALTCTVSRKTIPELCCITRLARGVAVRAAWTNRLPDDAIARERLPGSLTARPSLAGVDLTRVAATWRRGGCGRWGVSGRASDGTYEAAHQLGAAEAAFGRGSLGGGGARAQRRERQACCGSTRQDAAGRGGSKQPGARMH